MHTRIFKRLLCSSLSFALLVAPGLQPLATAATKAAIKCSQLKQMEAGKYAQCRLKTAAIATKKGVAPEYAKCDEKLAKKFQRLDTTVCEGQPPSAADIQTLVTNVADTVSDSLDVSGDGTDGFAELATTALCEGSNIGVIRGQCRPYPNLDCAEEAMRNGGYIEIFMNGAELKARTAELPSTHPEIILDPDVVTAIAMEDDESVFRLGVLYGDSPKLILGKGGEIRVFLPSFTDTGEIDEIVMEALPEGSIWPVLRIPPGAVSPSDTFGEDTVIVDSICSLDGFAESDEDGATFSKRTSGDYDGSLARCREETVTAYERYEGGLSGCTAAISAASVCCLGYSNRALENCTRRNQNEARNGGFLGGIMTFIGGVVGSIPLLTTGATVLYDTVEDQDPCFEIGMSAEQSCLDQANATLSLVADCS